MHIVTSQGLEPVNFNKILDKIKHFAKDLDTRIDPSLVAQKTIQNMNDGITTKDIDELSARIAANMASVHYDYSLLGGRILMSRLHKTMNIKNRTFVANLRRFYEHEVNGNKTNRVSKEVLEFAQRNESQLEELVDYDEDMRDYNYISLISMLRRGLETIDGETAETPAQMFLRVAIGLNIYQPRDTRELEDFQRYSGLWADPKTLKEMTDQERLEKITKYYKILVKRQLSLPGPIILHAGSKYNQMSSCYLNHITDSLTGDEYYINGKVGGILRGVTQLSAQSKGGGGTAINLHELRSSGSPIRKTNGFSNGILPFMKMFDSTIGAVNQSGKRAGTCAVYLEPWHADVLEFLDAANHFTIEEKRCKNLFYALWVNDLFFERLVQDRNQAKWTLFDPFVVNKYLDKPLSEYYGEEFKEKYLYLESLGIGKTIPLMEIWSRVCELFQTVGNPYIVNKDEINKKSNQVNIGTIKSSNLCTEISLVSNDQETAVCVLSSVVVSRLTSPEKLDGVDYEGIINVARLATRHLNNVIDLQYYPTPETRNSCLSRRAIGVGAQGLADVFHKLKLAFTSPKAQIINKRIYECIYFGCLLESMEMAKLEGSYLGFEGSPASQGVLQYDMWHINESELFLNTDGKELDLGEYGGGQAWAKLKQNIQKYGLRNSEVTALAPTASSAIRMGNNDMHEPYTRNLYIKSSIAGSLRVVNHHLQKELADQNLWNKKVFSQLVRDEGSVQNIAELSSDIKERYQTVYEMEWKKIIDMMADRSPFVSQTSSYNHYTSYAESGPTAFTQKIIYAWKKRLKTLSYYMHTDTASTAKKELGSLGDGWDNMDNNKPN